MHKLASTQLLLTRKHFIKGLYSMVKTHSLKTRRYDSSMTSPVAKKISNFWLVQYLFPPKHCLKIL